MIYLVILAGAVVRMTGSGMGCPDWPKCFGQYIPPTDISQLPEDYKEEYATKRKVKNQKLAGYLAKMGFAKLAHTIANDESVYQEESFNVSKTYIEYINRLVGAVSGLFLLALFIRSFKLYKQNRKLLLFSGILLLAILIQAWFGSIVVSTNLLPGTISVHMFLALVIVVLLLHLEKQSAGSAQQTTLAFPALRNIIILALIVSLIQILLGTQVRQEIDAIARFFGHSSREMWINKLSSLFYFHRSFSLFVLALNVWIVYQLYKQKFKTGAQKLIIALFILEIFSGVVMAYFDIPAAMQASHLFFASIAFGVQYYLMLNFGKLQPNENSL